MKKMISLLLVSLMMLGLCACGEGNGEENSTPPTITSEKELTAQEKKDLAMDCVDLSVDTLYEKIGEPVSSDYAPSCLDPDGGAEDGELIYDGFTVYTYRKNGTETVVDVE